MSQNFLSQGIPIINIDDFDYTLPEAAIAFEPLQQRDASKLLVYQNHTIHETIFSALPTLLPADSLLVFNNTKVIPARLFFEKENATSTIEIFCLEAVQTNNELKKDVGNNINTSSWKCYVGGASKWKNGALTKILFHNNHPIKLQAYKKLQQQDYFIIDFFWDDSSLSFFEILQIAGNIPLPPYIKRAVKPTDAERYQTVFNKYEGSVAAPTASLHFTDATFNQLQKQKIDTVFLTLHVGAGTFKPVKAKHVNEHTMHAEWVSIPVSTIQQLIKKLEIGIGVVGTTVLRSVESLYWLGVKILQNPPAQPIALQINQWEVYDAVMQQRASQVTTSASLTAILDYAKKHNLSTIDFSTAIIIVPGYQFKVSNYLITNFHQPKSTLLLLIAAAVGNNWKNIYKYALENNFRFLSYGDASLLFLNNN